MKQPTPMARLTTWLALALAPVSGAEAQSAAPSAAKTKEEEAVMLAPFQVVTANDDGWVAGSTMLGNRTNQPLSFRLTASTEF